MKFTKMQGIGNDYVYIDGSREKIEDPAAVARFVSDRHFGIGSDGLIMICPSEIADFEMRMYNADGSRGEMCGNGIRCVGKFVYDKGLTDRTSLTIETLAGIRHLTLYPENGCVKSVRVDMGKPVLEPEKIPTTLEESIISEDAKRTGSADGKAVVSVPLEAAGKTWRVTCVSMGNPHAVIFGGDPDELDLEKIGPEFEHHRAFPARVNTEFIEVIDRSTLKMRVWERGSGETLACGTGACAAAVAAVLNGLTERSVTLKLRGGDLMITWDEDGTVWMTGPAETVFEGEIEIPMQ